MRFLCILVGGASLLAVLLLASCGGNDVPALSGAAVAQVSWDTLEVSVTPQDTPQDTPQEAMQPLEVTVFDAAHNTLYAGPPGRIGIPDAALGDAEPLLVEVCAATAQGLVCEQEGLRTSPKRVVLVENDWEVPNVHDPARGRYALRLAVERQRFGGDAFERIQARAAVRTHVVAMIDEHPDTRVHLPLTGPTGTVDLTTHPGYRDFAFHLQSARVDGRPVAVTYAVYARLHDGPPTRVATHTHYVTPPTQAEHAFHIRWFAEQAGAQLLKVLGERGRAYADVFVDDWSFQPGLGRYVVAMEVRWSRPGRRWRGEVLQGILQVRQDGTQPQFELTRGNRRGLRLWERQELASPLTLERFYPLKVLPRIPDGTQTAEAAPEVLPHASPQGPPPAPDQADADRGRSGW